MQTKQKIINLLDVMPVDVIEEMYRYATELKKQKEQKEHRQGRGEFEELMRLVKNTTPVPDDTFYDEYKEISLRERGLLR